MFPFQQEISACPQFFQNSFELPTNLENYICLNFTKQDLDRHASFFKWLHGQGMGNKTNAPLISSKCLHLECLQDMYDLHHLYLTDNNLDHIPLPLPENLRALHLQVGSCWEDMPKSSMDNKSKYKEVGTQDTVYNGMLVHCDNLFSLSPISHSFSLSLSLSTRCWYIHDPGLIYF